MTRAWWVGDSGQGEPGGPRGGPVCAELGGGSGGGMTKAES